MTDNLKRKVLIVDAFEAFAHDLADVCQEYGYRVFLAFDLKSAKDVISDQEDLSLIVWDHSLPDGVSTDLIRIAKEKFPKTVMIASGAHPNNRRRQRRAGCQHGANPFRIETLVRKKLSLLPS